MTADENKPAICIVAHFAYGAMAGGATGHIGGVERQTSLTARWLADRGYPVNLLTWDEGQDDEVVIDGVRVIKMCRQDTGVAGMRFFHPRWTSLNLAMRRADADVYYQNCAEYVTGQVAMWCRRHGKAFVYSVANDPDCDPRLPDMNTIRERVLYRYGLRNADPVIVQTLSQQRMLRDGFGVASEVIPMPCPGPSEAEYVAPEPPDPSSARVLWIARIAEQKRPDRLMDLAEACPDVQFDFVGPADDTAYSQQVCRRAEGLANVRVHGSVARERVTELYRSAACLCCTSDFEGFPNTFLEAWSNGLPIASTFDPDGVIAQHGMGVVADDVPGLVSSLRNLIGSADEWRRASAGARRYYVENHTVEVILPRFEEAFVEAARRAKASR